MTKYNLADYAFKYNYAFGINTTLRDTTTASGGKSGIYVWPDGYFFGRDISYFKTTETCPVSDSYRNFTENLLTKILNNSITPKYTCTEVPKYQTGEQYYANSHCTLNTSFSEAGCLDGKKVYFGKQVTRNLLDLDPKIATCNARLQSSAILDRNGDPYVVPLACTSGYCYSDATNGYSVSETPYQVGMNPSPTLSQPAGSSDDGVCKGVENWGMENINNSIRVVSQYQYDGVAIDTYGSYGQQDFDLNHFTNVRVPLTYDKQTNRPIVYQPFSLYEYMNDLRRDLPADKMIYANGLGQSGSGFLQKNVDVFMGERKSNLINAGFDATGIIDPYLLRLRSLMSEKSHTVVISDYTSAEAMSKVNYLAFFGDFTYLSKDTDGKYFFTTASPTELQTAEYKATQQAVKKISEAGWEPVTYAQSGDPEVKIERFGGKNDGNIYLSVRNFSNIEKETKIVLDTKMLDISSVIDYVKVLGDSLVVKADNGFTIKTAPLQTYVLEVKYSDIALSSIGSINLTEGQVITTNPYIISVVAKDAAETLRISKVEFYIDDTLISTSTLPDVSGSYQAVWDTSKYHSTVKIIVYGTDGTTQELTRNTTVNLSGAQENNDIVVVLPKTGEEKWKDKAVSDIRSLWNKVFH